MKGFVENIETLTNENKAFRHVLYTGKHVQLVVMSLNPGEDIGDEKHAGHDQFFRIETGEGQMQIDGKDHAIASGDAVVVPAGARHNLRNTGTVVLKLYTLYGPPNHLDQLIHSTKAIAAESTESFTGVTTE